MDAAGVCRTVDSPLHPVNPASVVLEFKSGATSD